MKDKSKYIFPNIKPNYYGSSKDQISEFVLADIIGEIKSGERTYTDTSLIAAGYTYLGQFVAHDIVPSTTLFDRNISPNLNLDSLYGADIEPNPDYFDRFGRFKLTTTACSDSCGDTHEDIVRDANDKALIEDLRNDKNAIVSQLHLFWQQLHNLILSELFQKEIDNNETIKQHSVNKVRNYVVFIFHKIIKHDYLKKILHPSIYRLYCQKNQQFLYGEKRLMEDIPYEFSHAAFRFGHSMVRNNYRLNLNQANRKVDVKDLFLQKGKKQLTCKGIIDWRFFFNQHPFKTYFTDNAAVQEANRIDRRIDYSMHQVPFIDQAIDIRKINIEANLKANIATGLQVYKELNNEKVYSEISKLLKKEAKTYETLHFQKHTLPLWPYVLYEAELMNDTEGILGLGLIGSILVAEVLMQSINNTKIELEYEKPAVIQQFITNNMPFENDFTMHHVVNYLRKRKQQ